MRLRDLTSVERALIEARRDRVRAALARAELPVPPTAAEVDAAPFLDDYFERFYPGTRETCLHGRCWGHPVLGDTIVTTSIVVHRGEGWAITESGRVYLLGREDPEHRLRKALSGGRYCAEPPPQAPEVPEEASGWAM